MDNKVNFAAVGAFVLVLEAVLVAAALWLAAGGELHHKVDLYRAVSDESASGLNINAPLKYQERTRAVVFTREFDASAPVAVATPAAAVAAANAVVADVLAQMATACAAEVALRRRPRRASVERLRSRSSRTSSRRC